MTPVTAILAALLAMPYIPAPARAERRVQTVHEYRVPFGPSAGTDDRAAYDATFTHLGTDFGPIGPGGDRLLWEPGGWVRADMRDGNWGGMWHSLAGLAREPDVTLDLARCYPAPVRDPYQPVCRGVVLQARGTGRVKMEIKGPDQQLLWQQDRPLAGPPVRLDFDLDPAGLRRAKTINWVAEPGSDLAVSGVGLVIDFPAMTLPDRVFVESFAKLARCSIPGAGLVKDQAHRPAGAFEAVPASGMYALAAAVASERGVVDKEFAAQTLNETRRAFTALPKADGWLPHFVTRGRDGRYRLHPGTEYSTVDTALAYHGLLLAARVLGDEAAENAVLADVRKLRFDHLRGPDGYLRMGFKPDGRTPLASTWRDWGGEAALVALTERLARGPEAKPKMNKSGHVPDGVGFVAEIQSLFYPQFDSTDPDALTGVNWKAARAELVRDQIAAVAKDPRAAAPGGAAKLGLFGLSAGEGYRGRSYSANGTRTGRGFDVLHPHYVLMAGQAVGRPAATYDRLKALEDRDLLTPWGLVENVTPDLAEALPVTGSLNAAFECLSAYHLAARATGRADAIYDAARTGPAADAARMFYPRQ